MKALIVGTFPLFVKGGWDGGVGVVVPFKNWVILGRTKNCGNNLENGGTHIEIGGEEGLPIFYYFTVQLLLLWKSKVSLIKFWLFNLIWNTPKITWTSTKARLYVPVLSRMDFRVNPHSIISWMSRNSLLEAGTKSEV